MMYTIYIMKRTQIYLDEAQDRTLAERARRCGRTKSTLIRGAIAQYLTESPEGERIARLSAFRGALDRIKEHPLTYLPDGKTYVRQLRQADVARQRQLVRRWRG